MILVHVPLAVTRAYPELQEVQVPAAVLVQILQFVSAQVGEQKLPPRVKLYPLTHSVQALKVTQFLQLVTMFLVQSILHLPSVSVYPLTQVPQYSGRRQELQLGSEQVGLQAVKLLDKE